MSRYTMELSRDGVITDVVDCRRKSPFFLKQLSCRRLLLKERGSRGNKFVRFDTLLSRIYDMDGVISCHTQIREPTSLDLQTSILVVGSQRVKAFIIITFWPTRSSKVATGITDERSPGHSIIRHRLPLLIWCDFGLGLTTLSCQAVAYLMESHSRSLQKVPQSCCFSKKMANRNQSARLKASEVEVCTSQAASHSWTSIFGHFPIVCFSFTTEDGSINHRCQWNAPNETFKGSISEEGGADAGCCQSKGFATELNSSLRHRGALRRS